MQRIAIIGAGGHAREQLELIAAINAVEPRYAVEGFVVDAEYAGPGERVRGLPVLGEPAWLAERADEVVAVCAIGDSAARRRVVLRLEDADVSYETLVHPSAVVGESASLGEGCIVAPGAVLTAVLDLGRHVHVGAGSVVSHDCALGPFVSLAPGCHLAGAVSVGTGTQLGVAAAVRDRARIGEWSIVGAGAVVTGDLPGDCTAVGVPARVSSRRKAGWQDRPE